MKTLSLIVPAYNEADNIIPFYRRVCDVFENDSRNVEIVFVDDGSRDDTYQKIEIASCFKNPRVTVRGLSFSRNFGKEAAMLAGLRTATGAYFTFIDADLQQDPAYVRKMADILDHHPDVDVVAARQAKRREGRLQAFLKNGFYKMMNRLSDVPFENGVSDFRTFRRPVRDAMLSLTEAKRFTKGIFAWVGFHTVTIDYQVQDRQHGTSSWSLKKLFRYAADGMESFSDAGLKIAFPISGVLFAAAALWLIVSLSLCAGTLLTLLPFLIFLIGGAQMFVTGLLGSYLGRTYDQVRRRPAYIVRRKCGDEKAAYDIMKPAVMHREKQIKRRA